MRDLWCSLLSARWKRREHPLVAAERQIHRLAWRELERSAADHAPSWKHPRDDVDAVGAARHGTRHAQSFAAAAKDCPDTYRVAAGPERVHVGMVRRLMVKHNYCVRRAATPKGATAGDRERSETTGNCQSDNPTHELLQNRPAQCCNSRAHRHREDEIDELTISFDRAARFSKPRTLAYATHSQSRHAGTDRIRAWPRSHGNESRVRHP